MVYFSDAIENRYKIRREREPYVPPSVKKLDVFVTEEYTADFAWAHTIPSQRIICILPPERRDYRLPIIDHEVEHNVDPNASETLVTRRAYDPARKSLRSRFALNYHGGF